MARHAAVIEVIGLAMQGSLPCVDGRVLSRIRDL